MCSSFYPHGGAQLNVSSCDARGASDQAFAGQLCEPRHRPMSSHLAQSSGHLGSYLATTITGDVRALE